VFAGLVPAFILSTRQALIDKVLSASNLTHLILIYIVLLTLNTIVEILNARINEKLKFEVDLSLGKKRLRKCSRIPYFVFEREETQKLVFFSEKFPEEFLKGVLDFNTFLTESLKAAAILVTISLYDIKTGVFITIFTVCMMVFSLLNSRKTLNFWQKYMEIMRRSKYISSVLINREYMAEKKVFGYTDSMNKRFNKEFDKARRGNWQHALSRLKIDGIVEIGNIVFLIISFVILLNTFLSGGITLGAFTSIFFSLVNFFTSTKTLLNSLFESLKLRRQIQKWDDFLNLPETNSVQKRANKALLFKEIEFKSVVFSYPDSDSRVLKDLSFKLERGKHYSLVGENGSGKSTIVKLLLGMYAVNSGEILLDGVDIRKHPSEALQQSLSVVFQDFCAYPITIEENILMGNFNTPVDREKLKEIYSELTLTESLQNLPKGEQTVLNHLNTDSSNLSVGQLQKIAVARMLYADRDIVVLDEPNSALDPISEEKMYNTYRKILKDKTTLFISHRLGSVGLSDEVLVLRNGQICSQGTHNGLMAEKGYYYDLYTSQLKLYS
jgi:ATP-binding cassette subfamily B protein